ncbi:membrane-associated progesterone receptor component 2-like [Argonauta hians]
MEVANSAASAPLSSAKSLFVDVLQPLYVVIFGMIILAVILFASLKHLRVHQQPEVRLPRMKKRDMTITELRKYDGTGEDGRICIAVNRKVFDVTRGRKYYGPGGPYSVFAGRDASRALACFSVSDIKDGYDDLSDLTSSQMNQIHEWEMQLTDEYTLVGRLLQPGQQPLDYTDSEDEIPEDDKLKDT